MPWLLGAAFPGLCAGTGELTVGSGRRCRSAGPLARKSSCPKPQVPGSVCLHGLGVDRSENGTWDRGRDVGLTDPGRLCRQRPSPGRQVWDLLPWWPASSQPPPGILFANRQQHPELTHLPATCVSDLQWLPGQRRHICWHRTEHPHLCRACPGGGHSELQRSGERAQPSCIRPCPG